MSRVQVWGGELPALLAVQTRRALRQEELGPSMTVEVVPKADHDAVLRAAKAKVWREAATVHRQADGNDCKYCLARAAQIEEGE